MGLRSRFIYLLAVLFMVFCAPIAFLPAKAQDSQIINAIKLTQKGQWQSAGNAVQNVSDPVAKQTLSWLAYTKGAPNVSFQQITSFARKNPDWPYQITMRNAAENLLPNNYSDAQVIGWFSSEKPRTAKGMDRYVQALLKSNRTAEARKVLSEWWPRASLSRDQQQRFYQSYKSYINKSAHKKRMSHLIYIGQYTNARGIAGVLGTAYRNLAEARIALANEKRDVNPIINKVPSSLQNDEGLLYERLRWRRRMDLNSGAIDILNNYTPSASSMYEPSKWWRERHIIARRLMEEKQYSQAYAIVSRHKQKEGFSYSQAEWLAGFLSLEFLNKPSKAAAHFDRLYRKVKTPVSKARAAYWAGLASDKLNQKGRAQKWYAVAAQYPERFYGQLAFDALHQGRKASFNSQKPLSSEAKSRFKQKKFAKIAKWLSKAGYGDEAASFLAKLSDQAKDEQSFSLAADLAHSLGHDHTAIRIAAEAEKTSGAKLHSYSFPTKVAAIQNVRDVEWALVHSLMRQESRFDTQAKSHAGARGLMQLMPATAKQTARKMGVAHQTSWLTSRPSHNIKLGSRYLKQMLDRYNGYYPMAIAAYNAGPGRVDRWIKEIGDPRRGEIDLVTWGELIPIYETRNYVQRVMEGTYVYRSILGTQNKPSTTLHIASR